MQRYFVRGFPTGKTPKALGRAPGRLPNVLHNCAICDLIPFFGREPYRLSIPQAGGGENFIVRTNLDSYMMQCCNLSKAGFGSIREIKEMDTPEFFDLLEYEAISNDIYAYKTKVV